MSNSKRPGFAHVDNTGFQTTKRPGFATETDHSITTEPPQDGCHYVRQNGEWVRLFWGMGGEDAEGTEFKATA